MVCGFHVDSPELNVIIMWSKREANLRTWKVEIRCIFKLHLKYNMHSWSAFWNNFWLMLHEKIDDDDDDMAARECKHNWIYFLRKYNA